MFGWEMFKKSLLSVQKHVIKMLYKQEKTDTICPLPTPFYQLQTHRTIVRFALIHLALFC